MLSSSFYKNKPTAWLTSRISLTVLDDDHLIDEVRNLPFIHGHVGGHGTNSPKRGVCVLGNELDDGRIVDETYWTLTQNKSCCTLVTRTKPMPPNLYGLIPYLKEIASTNFPTSPLSSSSFALFVANEYLPNEGHTICAHTDDQPWYTDPPIFASVTFFPDGEPVHPDSAYRFQVLDEGDDTWKDMYLPHNSICMMRADIFHRVKPPLKKGVIQKRRINLTYRNLVDIDTDPLGNLLAFSNHYRYYGIPCKVIIPKEYRSKTLQTVVDRLLKINDKIIVETDTRLANDRNKTKAIFRKRIKQYYIDNSLSLNEKMMGKTNVVLEILEEIQRLV
jgi:hypothetical protein